MNEKDLSLFKLLFVTDIGSVKFFRLIDRFGDAESILKTSKKDLMSVEGIGPIIADTICNYSKSADVEKELETAVKNNIKIILYNNSDYPEPLRNLIDKPLIVYIKGSISKEDFNSISIVGSRKISNYGKTVTSEFASYFAKKGVTVISGLARGVDTQVHITALENKSRTIAVLGNGLLINYPPENKKLQEKIPQYGAIISEFPLNKQPDRAAFPRRNRIIAGLSRATLITEATLESGALITARFCAEYGKDVFAVPGNIYSNTSKGANKLIQNGAFTALSPSDMAKHLDWIPKDKISKAIESVTLNELELKVLNLIENDSAGMPLDLIVQKLNASIPEIAPVLLKLEINGLIKTAPGQVYIRIY
jgi:DNA processing protein